MMTDNRGWFGNREQLMHFLRVAGADRDAEGLFTISGEPISVGLGGYDVVIPAGTVYFVDGKAIGLASNLRGTSYGMGVVVI